MRVLTIRTAVDYNKDGEKRRRWFKVGELSINESGRMYMRMFHMPGIKFYVFEDEEKLPTIDADTNIEQEE